MSGASPGDPLMAPGRRVSVSTAQRLRHTVLGLSWTSIVILIVLGCLTCVEAVQEESSAALAFAIDAFLDCFSSIVLVWRYSGSKDDLYSPKKENIACTVLGALFMVSAVGVGARSIFSLVDYQAPKITSTLEYIYIVDCAACSLLAAAKIYLGWKLMSVSLVTDAVNSLVGAILSFVTLMGDIATAEETQDAWIVDPITGIVAAVFLIFYGLWLVVSCRAEWAQIQQEEKSAE